MLIGWHALTIVMCHFAVIVYLGCIIIVVNLWLTGVYSKDCQSCVQCTHVAPLLSQPYHPGTVHCYQLGNTRTTLVRTTVKSVGKASTTVVQQAACYHGWSVVVRELPELLWPDQSVIMEW